VLNGFELAASIDDAELTFLRLAAGELRRDARSAPIASDSRAPRECCGSVAVVLLSTSVPAARLFHFTYRVDRSQLSSSVRQTRQIQ
jgi:hypothetical protein